MLYSEKILITVRAMKKVLVLWLFALAAFSVLAAEQSVPPAPKSSPQLGGVTLRQADESGQLRLKDHAAKKNSSKQKIVISGGRSTLCRDDGQGVEKCEKN